MSAVKTRIMYIQQGLNAGRIGRVRSRLQGELRRPRDERHVLVSGPRRDGQDTLYPGVVEIDDYVIEEYWRDVRGEHGRRDKTFRSTGVHAKHATR